MARGRREPARREKRQVGRQGEAVRAGRHRQRRCGGRGQVGAHMQKNDHTNVP